MTSKLGTIETKNDQSQKVSMHKTRLVTNCIVKKNSYYSDECIDQSELQLYNVHLTFDKMETIKIFAYGLMATVTNIDVKSCMNCANIATKMLLKT